MQNIAKTLLFFLFFIPANARSETKFSLRLGTGVSIFLHIPEKYDVDTKRFSVPVTLGLGFLFNKKFGFHINAMGLFIDEKQMLGYLHGYVFSLSGEYHFLRLYNDLLDFYFLLGLGVGGVGIYEGPHTGMDDFEEATGFIQIHIGGGIDIKVREWISLGLQPRFRLSYPGHYEMPALELVFLSNMLWPDFDS